MLILVAMVGAVCSRGGRRAVRPAECLSMPTLAHYLVLSAVLFCIGTAGVFVRRNLITILLSIEIMLNAVNLTFVAFGRSTGLRRRPDHRVLRDDRRRRRSRRRPARS